MFIFRNNTIENLFDSDTRFSGYGDISSIPAGERNFAWFYQVPLTFDGQSRLAEVQGMLQKLQLVLNQLPADALLIVLSLENLFPIDYVVCETALEEAVASFNSAARNVARTDARVKFVDFKPFISRFPQEQWVNWKFYMLSQMVVNPALAGDFRQWWKHTVDVIGGKRKKCLVLDLDNTLWGGVLGEDGVSGIKIGGDYPGKAFLYFQEGIKTLASKGVILAACSKNNEADVLAAWRDNPFLVLRDMDFAARQINWDNKADNIRLLAKTLNIGTDSMVFVDDNPTERELVRQQLPEVAVPEFPKQPYALPTFFASLVNDYFQAYALTAEDAAKTEQYRANAMRSAEQEAFSDLTDFIRSLRIEMHIESLTDFNLARAAQMTQKTNQFNLTTHRYTERDLLEMKELGARFFVLSVKDKYGDNGITGLCISKSNGETAEIDTLLLSCRILGKRIENAFMATVVNRLRAEGLPHIVAHYLPTAKNSQVADFYNRLGFKEISANEGGKEYLLAPDKDISVEDLYIIN